MNLIHNISAVGALFVSLTSNCVASGLEGSSFYGSLYFTKNVFWQTSEAVGDGIEFAYEDVANRITADFTDTQLIVEDHIAPGYFIPFFGVNFTGPLGSLSLVSSNFPEYVPSTGFGGINYATTDLTPTSTIYTFNFFGDSTGGHDYRAVFNITPIPEPQTLALMLAGLIVIGVLARRQKTKVRSRC